MNDYLKCPITLKIFKNPVISKSGNIYEKKAIIKWLTQNKTDPLSREPLTIEDLIPVLAIKNIISMIPKKEYHIDYAYIDELIDCFDETKEKFMKKSTIIEYDNTPIYHKNIYCLLKNNCSDCEFNVNEYVYTDLLNFGVECNGINENSYITHLELYELKQLSNFLNCPKLYNLAECILVKVNKTINDLEDQFNEYENESSKLQTELEKNNEKLTNENNELKNFIETLKNNNKTLLKCSGRDNIELKKNYEELKKNNEVLCTEINQLKKNLEVLRTENNQLKQNYNSIKNKK
jgi:FtsZ-binding cell division protein ZapB